MFDKTSRYTNCEIATLKVTDSNSTTRELRYVRRRFIPFVDGMTVIAEHTVTQGDRLDNITAKYLGDPTQFWRICDANEMMKPEDIEENGRVIKIAMPKL